MRTKSESGLKRMPTLRAELGMRRMLRSGLSDVLSGPLCKEWIDIFLEEEMVVGVLEVAS